MYKGLVGKVKDEQKMLNMQFSDALITIEAREYFNEYYKDFKFGFGSNWMKPLFKQYFWWGYFAGYKAGLNK